MELIASEVIAHQLVRNYFAVVSGALGLLLCSGFSPAQAATLEEPPTLALDGSSGDAATNEGHAVSADGRYIAFTSYASNLVEGDSNGARDVFVWDSVLNTVQLVSRNPGGEQANGDSSDAVISADGQWVAFSSSADNLADDSNGSIEDIFLYSRVSNTLALVSVGNTGVQSAFASRRPDINANGRFVTFDTVGALVAGADGVTNQVYQRDTWLNTTLQISQTPAGVNANGLSMDAQMSADGQRVVFVSMATNLVAIQTVGKESYLNDLSQNRLSLLSLNANGEAGDGISYFPSISGDGRFAAFHTNASNLVANDRADVTDVVVRDIASGGLELLSANANGDAANDYNIHPSLSYDGQRVVFATNATNLVEGDAPAAVDIVYADRTTGALSLVNEATAEQPADGDSSGPSISMDGRSVSFASRATNLVTNNTAFSDVLVARVDGSSAAAVGLSAAVLPSSRSTALGDPVTAFASFVSSGLAGDCRVQLTPETTAAFDIDLVVQATNPLTNEVVGAANAPFLLLPGKPQTLLLTLTPNSLLSARELEFDFLCASGNAPITPGTNTLLVSAESVQSADVVALVATVDNNGIVTLPEGGGSGFFSVASVNLGATGSLRVRPVVLGEPLDGVSVCQTNPLTSECLEPASGSVLLQINQGETPTFGAFLSHGTAIPFAPAENRVTVQFEDANGVVRGRTSVAIRTLEPGL